MSSIEIRQFPNLHYAGQEAVNTLCTNLSFSGNQFKKIMLTSSHASEGKSYLAMNIMRTMAKYGKRVALVDADLRRSYMAAQYGFRFSDKENQWGMAHYLAGMVEMESVIYSTNIEGAYIVPVGREVSNPLPLLNSERLGELLDYLAQKVDYVLVDAPPIGLVVDAAQIAKSCDGTLVVVSYNKVHRQELLDVKEQLDQSGCTVIGAVLNQVAHDAYGSKKYYTNAYYKKRESVGRRRQKKDAEGGK